jgi:peptidoglycan/LPS O-acetylase OafA/YrhL
LELYSPIWALCVYGVAFITAFALIAIAPFCRVTSQDDGNRFSKIDGLRGYLAIGVFISHAASIRQWQEFGVWAWPQSTVFTLAGSVPVSLFFMITAFLFWGKAIRSKGQIDPRGLFASRFRRLAPLYICTMPLLLLLVGNASDWTLRADLGSLFLAIGRWSLIGAGGWPDINGVVAFLFYPQIWTLLYEWLFYGALPIIALLRRPPGNIFIIISAIIIIISAVVANQRGVVHSATSSFAVGILVAELFAFRSELKFLRTWWATLAAIIGLILLGVVGKGDFNWKETVCIIPLFACVCYGNSMFGFLSNGPARLLGAISYSTYLLHAFALHFSVQAVNYFAKVGTLMPCSYWPLILLLTVLLVTASVITFRFIEQPWMGKRRVEGPPRPAVI